MEDCIPQALRKRFSRGQGMQNLQVQRNKELHGLRGRAHAGNDFAVWTFRQQTVIQVIDGMAYRFQSPALFAADDAARVALDWTPWFCMISPFTMCRLSCHVSPPPLLKTIPRRPRSKSEVTKVCPTQNGTVSQSGSVSVWAGSKLRLPDPRARLTLSPINLKVELEAATK